MRKGFTMIELIFVIVILGILAAVAIPRIAATRDDAEIAKVTTNLTTLMSDLGAYYTSQAKFEDTLRAMTIVPLAADGAGLSDNITAAGKKCVLVTAVRNQTDGTPAYLTVAAGGQATEGLCPQILAEKAVKDLITASAQEHKFTKTDGSEGTYTGIPVAGMRVIRN
jgi:prokaryotic N-methylation motif domain protein